MPKSRKNVEAPTSMYHADLTRHTHGVHARKRLRDRGVMVETSRSGSWSFEPPRDSGQDTCLLVWTRHSPRDSGQGPDCPNRHSNQIRICPRLSHLRRRLQAGGAIESTGVGACQSVYRGGGQWERERSSQLLRKTKKSLLGGPPAGTSS